MIERKKTSRDNPNQPQPDETDPRHHPENRTSRNNKQQQWHKRTHGSAFHRKLGNSTDPAPGAQIRAKSLEASKVTKHVRRQGYRAGSRHADRLQNRFHTLPCGRGHSIASPPRDRRVAPSCLCCTTGRWLKDAAPLSTAAAEWRWWTGGGNGDDEKGKGKGSREARDCLHRLPVSTSGAPRYLLTMATPTPPPRPPPILCSSPLALSALSCPPPRPPLALLACLLCFACLCPPASLRRLLLFFCPLFNSSLVPSRFSGLPRRTGKNSPFSLRFLFYGAAWRAGGVRARPARAN
jgi:hypothetical protein